MVLFLIFLLYESTKVAFLPLCPTSFHKKTAPRKEEAVFGMCNKLLSKDLFFNFCAFRIPNHVDDDGDIHH